MIYAERSPAILVTRVFSCSKKPEKEKGTAVGKLYVSLCFVNTEYLDRSLNSKHAKTALASSERQG